MTDFNDFKFHKSCLLMPILPPEDYAALKADIAEHGQELPILRTADGQIYDGRHRLRACLELGFEPDIQDDDTEVTDEEMLQAVLSLNLHRRHLSSAQRIELAKAIVAPVKDGVRVTQVELAEHAGTSPRQVERYTSVEKKGTTTLKAAVQNETISLKHAERIAQLDPPQQNEVVKRVEAGAKPTHAINEVIPREPNFDKEYKSLKGHYLTGITKVSMIHRQQANRKLADEEMGGVSISATAKLVVPQTIDEARECLKSSGLDVDALDSLASEFIHPKPITCDDIIADIRQLPEAAIRKIASVCSELLDAPGVIA